MTPKKSQQLSVRLTCPRKKYIWQHELCGDTFERWIFRLTSSTSQKRERERFLSHWGEWKWIVTNIMCAPPPAFHLPLNFPRNSKYAKRNFGTQNSSCSKRYLFRSHPKMADLFTAQFTVRVACSSLSVLPLSLSLSLSLSLFVCLWQFLFVAAWRRHCGIGM